LLEYLGFHLGKNVADIVNLLDPEVVVVALSTDFRRSAPEETMLEDNRGHAAEQKLSEIEEAAIMKAYSERVNNTFEAPRIRFTYIRRPMILIGALAVAIDNLFSGREDLLEVAGKGKK
jgi:predicted NBD/HSP70 family sugar kinase